MDREDGIVNYLLHSSCTWEMEESLLSLSSYSSEIGTQQCHYCTNKYTCTEEHLIHMKNSVSQLTKRNICKKCYKSEMCNKDFTHKCHLIKHTRVHNGEKLYNCNQCDKEFIQKSNLTDHMRVHTGEKPYKCNQCNKEFTQKGSLTRHMTIHSGSKRYKCFQCDKEFSQKGNLKTHMGIHLW